MARTKPDDLQPSRSLDEMNVARLSLISLQRQVAEDYTQWEAELDTEGMPVHVSCKSTEQVPHGIDTEIYLAILKLYQLSGSPSDGQVTVTPHELTRAANMSRSSRSYQTIKLSLTRLNRAIYQIDQGWRDFQGMRWHSVTFQHIAGLEYTKNQEHHIDGASVIHITFPQHTVKSIQAGYLNPLNYRLIQQFKQPTSVALCRTLEALRRDPSTTQVVKDRLEFHLLHWAKTLRLEDGRPDNIRRSLANPHQELLDAQYLRSVEYVGRGSKQVVVYELFPQHEDEHIKTTIDLLTHRGVTAGSARALVAEFPDRIQDAVARFDQLKNSGYSMKVPGGLLVDIIRHPENYDKPETSPKPTKPKKNDSNKKPAVLPLFDEETLEQRISTAMFLLQGHFSTREQDQLRRLLQSGQLKVDGLHTELLNKKMKGQLEEHVQALKQALRENYS